MRFLKVTWLWGILWVGLVMCGACGQVVCAEAAQVVSAEAGGTSSAETASVRELIWQVQVEPRNGSEDNKEASLLLAGSIHLLRKEDHPLPEAYAQALDWADEVYVEIAPEALKSPAVGMKFMQAAKLPKGTTDAYAYWSQEEAERLKKALQARGEDPKAYGNLRPWMGALQLTIKHFQSLGVQSEYGVEAWLEEQTEARKLSVKGLEEVEDQVRVFAEMSEAEEKEMFEDALGKQEELPTFYREMARAWKEGDEAALEKMLFKDKEKFERLYDMMMVQRNEAWLKKLVPMVSGLDEKPSRVLVVVGSAHLLGKDGLVKRFQEEGFEVKRWQRPVVKGSGAE